MTSRRRFLGGGGTLVFGAPIAKEDVDAIAEYLATNYGKQAPGK